MSAFIDTMSLKEARDLLRTMVDDGEKCPCCTQFAKVYKRKVNSGMARSLITMYRLKGTNWIHLPTEVGARSREEGKLRYWGLVEEDPTLREDGGRQGTWRVTRKGELWITRPDIVTIPKYAKVYDGRCLGFTGAQVTIKDALGDKFDYRQLMSA